MSSILIMLLCCYYNPSYASRTINRKTHIWILNGLLKWHRNDLFPLCHFHQNICRFHRDRWQISLYTWAKDLGSRMAAAPGKRNAMQFGLMINCMTGRWPTDYLEYGWWCGLTRGTGTPVDATDEYVVMSLLEAFSLCTIWIWMWSHISCTILSSGFTLHNQ